MMLPQTSLVEEHAAKAFRSAAVRLLDHLDSESKVEGGVLASIRDGYDPLLRMPRADMTSWVAGV
jgi:hypothetical protein